MTKFLDLRAINTRYREDMLAAHARVIDSGWYIGGPEVEAFEQEFAAYCETGHAVGVANGLDALALALRAMDVRPGDEVIVPSNTYIATWLAVSQCGAIPVPVEPDPITHNIDPRLIEAAITPRTRVLLPVHLYGQPADLDPILTLAERYGLRVLEDGAQAHGARYKNKRLGGHGHAVAWSFYPGKNLGALGDGGAITTNDDHLAERLRMLRNYGSRIKYVNEVQGFNSRLDPVQAAILRLKLRDLDAANAHRRQIARLYIHHLAEARSILTLPSVPEWAEPVWHLFVVRHPQRRAFIETLTKRNIETLIHYPIPPHRQAAYAAEHHEADAFPIANTLAREVLSLPMGPHLQPGDMAALSRTIASAAIMSATAGMDEDRAN